MTTRIYTSKIIILLIGFPLFFIFFSSDAKSVSPPSNLDEFTIKDIGFFGAATRIEAKGEYMYLAYTSGIATFRTNTAPHTQVGNFYLPSKMSDWKIFGDYIFMVGDFGLRIYKLSELQKYGPPALAASYGGITFHDVSIQNYSGQPINGTLVAAGEHYDAQGSPRIFFFQWNETSQTLEHLSTYEGDIFLRANNAHGFPCYTNQDTLLELALDPLNPKLYAATCTDAWRPVIESCCYLYEFNTANINTVSFNGDRRIEDHFHAPSDMEVYQDKLWIGLYGITLNRTRAFNSYDLHADELFTERTYINACSQIAGGYGSCTSDSQCISSLPSCSGQCISGECQCCITDQNGYLDIIPEDNLVVGSVGTSSDNPDRHNIFLFDVNAPPDQHYADASSESIDWAFDIAGIPGKIFIADEWTSALSLNYQKSPLNIIHHAGPESWDEPTRIFSPGWNTPFFWEHNGRVYGGDNQLMSADVNDLGNFTKWRSWDNRQDYQWISPKGVHRGNYIFAKGVRENFAVIADGARLMIIYEDPSTHEFSLVNNSPLHYQWQINYSDTTEGRVLWPEENVAFTTLGNLGLVAFYIDAQQGILEERTRSSDVLPLNSIWLNGEGYSDLVQIDNDTIAVANGYVNSSITCDGTENSWGGVHFFKVSYPQGLPDPQNKNRQINLDFYKEVNALRCWDVPYILLSQDGWLMAVANRLNFLGGPSEQRIVLFRYSDIDNMNSQADQSTVLESITLPYNNFDPPPNALGYRIPGFWSTDKIVVPMGRTQAASTGDNGVYVFDRNTKQQLYYYPAFYNSHMFLYDVDFARPADPNLRLLPPPQYVVEASNGDILVSTLSGQIARLGNTVISCVDNDSDGYGQGCSPGADCNDGNSSIHPGVTEICSDDIDQDCSGSDLTCSTCLEGAISSRCLCEDASRESGYCCSNSYQQSTCTPQCIDNDGDGYGDNCTSENDCNDNDANINPGATDICSDNIDQDCSGSDSICNSCMQEIITSRCLCNNIAQETGYCCDDEWQSYECFKVCTDSDSDGYSITVSDCGQIDCNDNNLTINPGASEICSDGIDQDCSTVDLICAQCTDGQIQTRCLCEESPRENGYCYDNIYQTSPTPDSEPGPTPTPDPKPSPEPNDNIYQEYFGSGADSDSDGIPDDKEINLYKTDPNNPDTDGDGYADGEEIYSFYPPLSKTQTHDQALADRLKGRILLQAQEHGEAWYIYPNDTKRYYLGRPHDAFDIMRYLGLGIKHNELNNYLNNNFPTRLSGIIMLDVEQNGEAYYVNPVDLKGYYLGRPHDAFDIMRNLGLGITFNDLVKIKK